MRRRLRCLVRGGDEFSSMLWKPPKPVGSWHSGGGAADYILSIYIGRRQRQHRSRGVFPEVSAVASLEHNQIASGPGGACVRWRRCTRTPSP